MVMNEKFRNSFYSAFLISICLFFIFSELDLFKGKYANAQKLNSCVTDKCHSIMGKDKFVHGPIAVGDCLSCHKQTAKHTFTPITKVSDLCYKCHEKVDSKKDVHKPVKDGNCTKCHDPHQSAFKFQLKADSKNICFNCHDKKIMQGSFVHGPVAVGGCSVCHNPHHTDFPKLLNASGNNVCYACHTDKVEAFKDKKFVHKPVSEKCVSCHSPHSGNYKFMFNEEGSQELCFGCHKDKKEWIENVTTKHMGLYTEKKCLACHDAHVSNYVKQLVKQPVDTCNMCHDRVYNNPNSKDKVINMKEFLTLNKIYHGPIKQGDCSSCHNTHGSNNFRILRKYFPKIFYASFDPKNYELCFGCHEKTLVTESKTTTLTGFRNGSQNLHFVHVNMTKGRTCRACHDAHATNNPKHIRDGVPFGEWILPIGFEQNQDGGSCLPGCHQRFEYNRTKAVKNR
jgi:predicted CXXCH cytochrome family protein